MKKFVALAAMSVFLLTSTAGCMGRMALAGMVGKFNMEVADTKWPRWGVFVLLYIIPVYPLAGAIDLLIINSIEFHTGTNPLNDKPALASSKLASHRVDGPNGEFAISTRRADGSIDIAITDATGREHFANLIQEGGFYVARDANGKMLARIDDQGQIESFGL